MKIRTNAIRAIVAAGAVVACLALVIQPAGATDDPSAPPPVKKTQKHRTKSATPNNYQRLEPYRSSGFKGDYPGDCANMRANGVCMIDLGYGRCVSCDMGGGGGKF